MIEKVVIANRGEIALRILRACRDLGISTVALHSESDSTAKYVALADESVCIGPAESELSYLNIPAVIAAAEVTDASAIHPGYGFLAENPDFAERVEESGFIFIGPPAHAVRSMGNKLEAIRVMREAGLNCVPGSEGPISNDLDENRKLAEEIGYPILIKASAGGGGKGMRLVSSEAELEQNIAITQGEAKQAFGDSTVYMEKFLIKPRHIEIQVVADKFGNIVHLGDRECSIQRRRQKLIEEAPAPGLDEATRNRIGALCVEACHHVGYFGVGTFEFLLSQGEFYFIEMNTRIQVEHPVTECVTGIDIVKQQIYIASDLKLKLRQKDIKLKGHAIECRINAEHPQTLMPSPGTITQFHLPGGPGVRVDSHAYSRYEIPIHYDSLLAKVITHGQNRTEALARMDGALQEMVVDGVHTTIPLHRRILEQTKFQKADIDILFLEHLLGT